MTIHGALINAKIYVDGLDLSTHHNAVSLVKGVEPKDCTAFGDGQRVFVPGLRTAALEAEGFDDTAVAVSNEYVSRLGLAGRVITVAPTGAEGEVSEIMAAMFGLYNPGSKLGDVFGFKVSAQSTADRIVGSTIMHAKAARTTSASGTARQLGAVSAAQSVYAALHVFAVSGTGGPTLTVKVQSDNDGGFPSAADRITFAAATAIGAEWSKLAGAITDDWWRIDWAITGTTPSFTFAVAVGIA